jgi:hypothetical protein
LRKKTNSKVKSINFDNDVLKELEIFCKRNNTNASAFVNYLVRNTVFNEEEYYRNLAKFHCAEMNKYQYMVEQAKAKKI